MIIAANWKMNLTIREAKPLVNSIKKYKGRNKVILCPTFTLLPEMAGMLKKSRISLGAQNCHFEQKGAFTGEVSPLQLKDVGVSYVIIGHSERRSCNAFNPDYNRILSKKIHSAINAGLIPIICIGETDEQRKKAQTKKIIKKQIEASVPKKGKYIVAYEPVWAIGSGKTPTREQIEDIHEYISKLVPGTKILYGGSVNEKNCKEIASISGVSGFLVGGASLEANKFKKIMHV
jgi:triosephosphate isomerase